MPDEPTPKEMFDDLDPDMQRHFAIEMAKELLNKTTQIMDLTLPPDLQPILFEYERAVAEDADMPDPFRAHARAIMALVDAHRLIRKTILGWSEIQSEAILGVTDALLDMAPDGEAREEAKASLDKLRASLRDDNARRTA